MLKMESTENEVIEIAKKTGNPLYVLAYAIQELDRIADLTKNESKIDRIKCEYYSLLIRGVERMLLDAKEIKTQSDEIKKFFDTQAQVVSGLEEQIKWILHLKLILTEGEQEVQK